MDFGYNNLVNEDNGSRGTLDGMSDSYVSSAISAIGESRADSPCIMGIENPNVNVWKQKTLMKLFYLLEFNINLIHICESMSDCNWFIILKSFFTNKCLYMEV